MRLFSRLRGRPTPPSVPYIAQRDATECGTTCLAMVFSAHGLYDVQHSLRELAAVGADGTDLFALAGIAERFGFEADGYQLGYDDLPQLPLPSIAHVDGTHFVVLSGVSKDRIQIIDPAFGEATYSREEFERRWSGVVLALTPKPDVFEHPDIEALVAAQRAKERDVRGSFYTDLLRFYRRYLLEILFASVLLQLLGLALPLLTQFLIDTVLVYEDRRLLFGVLLGLGIVFGTIVLVYFVRNRLLVHVKVRMEYTFFSRFFAHFIRLEQAYFDTHKREDFIQRFQENLKIRKAIRPNVLEAALDFILVVNWLALLYVYNVPLGALATGIIAVYVLCMARALPRLRTLEDQVFHESVRSMGVFLDTLLGMLSVKLLRLENRKLLEWQASYRRTLNRVMRAERVEVNLRALLQGIRFCGLIAIYWGGAYVTFEGGLSVGQYVAFITIFTLAMGAVDNASSLWFLAAELGVTYRRINDVLMQPKERKPESPALRVPHRPDVTLDRLTFAYPGADEPALFEVSATIPYGQHIAIVGRNGSGKSTLVKLLAGLYDGYDGALRFGGLEASTLGPTALRQAVAMVPQEVYLFAGTIRENIQCANPSASMEEIVEAARLADLHPFVERLHLGYNHAVGETGQALSGGQRLKIAFARLFVSRPDIIVLDEASSVLDAEAERRILSNVRKVFAGRTVISIAHRLHTVRHADQILVLDEGVLAEAGTHDTLMAHRGVYHHLLQQYVAL
ncbi:MAG: peptidase domain-containing ABC transporter [Bacteroidota bacterium]